MRKTPILSLAGLVGMGLVSVPVASAVSASDDTAYLKRDDQAADLVLVSDDDDDDDTGQTRTRTRSGTGTGTGKGDSVSTNDNTRSNVTGVSRDRDLSRGDKTRDWTRDDGTRTRDHTANRTNDRSRNDTRR